jgi:hypothetical protein
VRGSELSIAAATRVTFIKDKVHEFTRAQELPIFPCLFFLVVFNIFIYIFWEFQALVNVAAVRIMRIGYDWELLLALP